MRRNADYVMIASHIFIERHVRRFGKYPSGVIFNKFMTLLHRDLKAEGVDIRLPHCWYRWGDVVVRYCLPYLSWTHDDLERTEVSYDDDAPEYDENDDTVIRIGRYADDFLDRFGSGEENVELVVDDVYSKAPFAFQNDFRMLRESLDIGRKNASCDNYEGYILSLLGNAEKSYPNAFRETRKEFRQFASVFRESVRAKAPREDLFELAEYYWSFFCYSLRLNKKCHENVPIDTLYRWSCTFVEEQKRYQKNIQIFAYDLCPKSDDATVKEILRERDVRLSELKELLKGIE